MDNAHNLTKCFLDIITLFIIVLFFSVQSCTPKITPVFQTDNLQLIAEDFIQNDTILQKHFIGFLLIEMHKQEPLISIRADKYFTPASNMKLYTFYLASKILEHGIPAFEYALRGDSLIIRGTADPSFLFLDTDPKLLSFLRQTNKKIFFSGTNFSTPRFGAGWAWDDYPYPYQKELSPLPIYGNAYRLQILPNDAFKTYPKFFEQFVQTDSSTQNFITRAEHSNLLRINPHHAPLQKRSEYTIPFKYSPQLLTQLLADTLHKSVTLLDQLPDNIIFRTVFNQNLDSLYRLLLMESDNFVAEQLVLASSHTLFGELNTAKVIRWALDSLLDDMPQNIRWVDGSGLSRYNLVSPKSNIYILQRLLDSISLTKLLHILPNTLNQGTLPKAFGRLPIYAKTGTLSNNFNLSGYLQGASGKYYIFSFMNNHYLSSKEQVAQHMAIFFEKIYMLL